MSFSRWERITEIPLLALSMLFLVAYSWQVFDPGNEQLFSLWETVILAVWVLFGIDYVVRLVLVRGKTRWFFHHLLDLLVLVLPALLPLRLLRVVSVLDVLNRTMGGAVRNRILVFSSASTVLLVYLASLAVWEAEREEGTITTFWDALWWSAVTITTVGYGDYSPQTLTGRLIAVGLMVGGVVLVGIIVGTLSSWIVERVTVETEEVIDETLEAVAELRDEVRALRLELDRREGPGSGRAAPS